MDLLAIIALPSIGAAFGRWTRWPPVAIGLVVGVIVAGCALAVFGGTTSPAAVQAALLIGIAAAALTAVGAFVGWLRRRHRERKQA